MSSNSNSSNMLQSRRTLYVGGLTDQVGDATLRAAFIPFGPLKSIDIPRDYTKNSHNKGFGFVEFEDPSDAADALDNMEGSELMGKTLSVSLAQPSHQSQNNKNAAVWSTDEWFQEHSNLETDNQQQKRVLGKTDESQLQQQVAMP